ncbi:MAG: hypothetical protein ACREEX_14330, partial [Caulobacteraceae bacterium]
LYKCYGKHPRAKVSLKVGTIFEDSPLGLEKWLPAMWLVVNAKNGISSCEIGEEGPGHAHRIETWIGPEAAVLDSDESLGRVPWETGQIDRRAVAAAAQPDHFAVAVQKGDLGIAPDRGQGGKLKGRGIERQGGDEGEHRLSTPLEMGLGASP